MRIRDLKVGTRLIIGMSVVTILTFLLGWVSWLQSKQLWQATDDLYHHPYTVGAAARDIKFNVLEIHILMKDVGLDPYLTNNELNYIDSAANSLEAEIYRNFDIVSNQFLGPKEIVDSAMIYVQQWKIVRDNLISLRYEKGYEESRVLFRSVNRPYALLLVAEINKMTDFALSKGESFYFQAEEKKDALARQLLILIFAIILISLITAYLTGHSIVSPIKELTTAANNYKQGDHSSRCTYSSDSEIGKLAGTFNNLADVLQKELSINGTINKLSRELMTENELKPFCMNLVQMFLSSTEAQVVGIYILNDETGNYENIASAGLNLNQTRSFNQDSLEGEIGVVISSGKIIHTTSLPKKSLFTFYAVTGDIQPAEIISIPIKNSSKVQAVISICSVKPFSESTIRIVNGIWITLMSRMIEVINLQKLKVLYNTLETQNRELEEKSNELKMQTEELHEYNIELEIQKNQIDEASRLKSTFLSNMSHELRTPLNSIIALSGVLERRFSEKILPEEAEYLRIIERNGKNLLTLINDILDLSRIEAGKEEVNYSEFLADELMNEVVLLAKPLAEEKGLTIRMSSVGEIPIVTSDHKKCFHIYQNLISNAIKFTESGGITISVTADDEYLVITVSDTGIGISKKFLPFIFDEFRQSDDKVSRKYSGSGLGLSIVKKYCKLLNGDIEAKSEHGKGSIFTVRLPINKSMNSGRDKKSENDEMVFFKPDVENNPRVRRKIMIVEDNEAQVIQIRELLNNEGFITEVAGDGRDALKLLAVSLPDAMILDLQMPDIDGFGVLKEIKNMPGAEKIPIIIMSAKHLTKAELQTIKGNNIHQCIQKGNVNLNDLKGYIRKIFQSDSTADTGTISNLKKEKVELSAKKILIIEDNRDNLTTFNAILGGRYNVITASDGPSGLKKAIDLNPDLILLDLALPEMDGFKVLRELKNLIELSLVPVVAITARAMKGDREEILSHGFDGYISKPIDNELFEKLIIEYLSRKR